MNKKAKTFKSYLKKNKIEAFTIEEVEDDKNETVVFRSSIVAAGQRLPTILIVDKSIFTIIRVQIAPQVLTEESQAALLKFANEENFKYKPFKFYFNPAGNFLLDVCIIDNHDEIDGDEISLVLNVLTNFLNDSYRDMMKAIW